MIDFEALITAAMKEGVSQEDLAAQFTTALNKRKEPEKKSTPREITIQGVKNVLDEHIKNEKLDLSDAAAIAWLCAVEDTNEGKDMETPEELMEFLEFISEDLSHVIEKWEAQKALRQIFKFDKYKCKNKREDKEAVTRSDRKTKTDGDIIETFLRGMGLL